MTKEHLLTGITVVDEKLNIFLKSAQFWLGSHSKNPQFHFIVTRGLQVNKWMEFFFQYWDISCISSNKHYYLKRTFFPGTILKFTDFCCFGCFNPEIIFKRWIFYFMRRSYCSFDRKLNLFGALFRVSHVSHTTTCTWFAPWVICPWMFYVEEYLINKWIFFRLYAFIIVIWGFPF